MKSKYIATIEDFENFAKTANGSCSEIAVSYANHLIEKIFAPKPKGVPSKITNDFLRELYKALRKGENAKKFIEKNTDIKYSAIQKHLHRNGLSIRDWKDNVPKWDEMVGRL